MKYSIHPVLFLGFLAMLFSSPIIAQKAKYKIADTYVKEFNFSDAAEVYEDILKKHPEDTIALRAAAYCYSNLRKPHKAEAKLKTLSELPTAKPDDLFNYAHALRMNKKYAEALDVYRKLEIILPDDPVVMEYLSDPEVFEKITRDSTRFDVKASSVNTEASDFGVDIIDGEVIFCSARKEGRGSGRVYAWNNQSYLNLFSAELGADSTLSNPKAKGRFFNTRFHEGTMAWDSTSQTLYLTRNNVEGNNAQTSDENQLNLALYSSTKEGEDWSDPVKLDFNNKEYSYGHPAITADGNTLYFVSDQGGGIGGSDIWYCKKIDDVWSPPQNLGFKVNTPGDEMFPFVLGNKLFFSSDGHPGLGGLDVFYAVMDGETILKVNNLGYPLNSSSDDFSIFLFEGGKRGFFASDRPGGLGDDDIYEIVISAPKVLHISGRILDDETNEPLEGATVILEKLMGEDNGTLVGNSGPDGSYEIEIPFASSLDLKALKKMYFPEVAHLEPDAISGYIENVDIRMRKFDYAVEGIVRTAEDDKPTAGALVVLRDSDGNVIEEITTEGDGKYFFILDENQDYNIEVSKNEYLTQDEDLSTKNREKGIIQMDFTLFKPEKGVVVKVDNIYYDFNSAKIRPDAAKELDRLVKILKDNPTMEIELGSHTDSQGTDSYNLSLSKKRAKSAVDYLITQGINKSRLKSKGYGETKIKNRCKNGVECSDEEHEENRRTEFIILDI